jgi:hypothetical protein
MCQTDANKISYAANLTWSEVVQFLQTCSVTDRSRLEICRVPTSSFQKELHTSTDRTIICFKQTCNCEYVAFKCRIRSASANRRPAWPCHCQHFCPQFAHFPIPLFLFQHISLVPRTLFKQSPFRKSRKGCIVSSCVTPPKPPTLCFFTLTNLAVLITSTLQLQLQLHHGYYH